MRLYRAFVALLVGLSLCSGLTDRDTADSKSDAKPATPPTRQQTTPYKSHPVDAFLFQPAKHPIGDWSPRDLDFKDVWFQSKDGTKLHGWLCEVAKPTAIVLYAHGNAGNVTHRANRLRLLTKEVNVTVLAFDYRGYGQSVGLPTQAGMLADAHSARAFLARQTSVNESDIVLMGRSLGGAVVIQLAAETSPRGLVVESSFSSLKAVAQHLQPSLAFLVDPTQLDSAKQIGKYTGPLFHSHGDQDRVIPYSHGQILTGAAGSKVKRHIRIRGGGHSDALPPLYHGELAGFISSLPKPVTTPCFQNEAVPCCDLSRRLYSN